MSRRVGPFRLIDRVSWSPSQPRKAPRLTLGLLFSTSLSTKSVRRKLSTMSNDDHAGYRGPARKSIFNDN